MVWTDGVGYFGVTQAVVRKPVLKAPDGTIKPSEIRIRASSEVLSKPVVAQLPQRAKRSFRGLD